MANTVFKNGKVIYENETIHVWGNNSAYERSGASGNSHGHTKGRSYNKTKKVYDKGLKKYVPKVIQQNEGRWKAGDTIKPVEKKGNNYVLSNKHISSSRLLSLQE